MVYGLWLGISEGPRPQANDPRSHLLGTGAGVQVRGMVEALQLSVSRAQEKNFG